MRHYFRIKRTVSFAIIHIKNAEQSQDQMRVMMSGVCFNLLIHPLASLLGSDSVVRYKFVP